MIYKLPRWASAGATSLAFMAGIINAIGFLSFQHQGVTHLTGSTTLLAIAAAQGDLVVVLHLVAVAGSFIAGCIVSGIIVQDSTLKLGRRYGVALAGEALLLCLAVPLLEHGHNFGLYCASCACGLQNGMVSTYTGAALRTTHVSGALTDLGIQVGHVIRGMKPDRLRIRICVLLIAGFFFGACAGALGFGSVGYLTLYFPAAFVGVTGIAYTIYRHRQMRAG
jgi:uncharacterized membrane protein YoaK (UPF0700 family)